MAISALMAASSDKSVALPKPKETLFKLRNPYTGNVLKTRVQPDQIDPDELESMFRADEQEHLANQSRTETARAGIVNDPMLNAMTGGVLQTPVEKAASANAQKQAQDAQKQQIRALLGSGGLDIARKMSADDIQALPLGVRKSLQRRMMRQTGEGAMADFNTATNAVTQAIPNAVSYALSGGNAEAAKGIAPRVGKGIAEVGQYFIPYLGQALGTVGGVQIAGNLANDPQSTAAGLASSLDPRKVLDPNLDPVERALTAFNIVGTAVGAVHGAKVAKGMVTRGMEINAVRTQLKIPMRDAANIVDWSRKLPDATATGAIPPVEKPVGTRGASTRKLPATPLHPELGPAPAPPTKAGAVVKPGVPETKVPTAQGKPAQVPGVPEIAGGNRAVRGLLDEAKAGTNPTRAVAIDALRRMSPDDPRLDPKSRFFNKELHDAVDAHVYNPDLDSQGASTADMLAEWHKSQPRYGQQALSENEAAYLSDVRGGNEQMRVPLRRSTASGEWKSAGKPIKYVDIGQNTPEQIQHFMDWYAGGGDQNATGHRASMPLDRYQNLKATQSQLKGGIRERDELMQTSADRGGDASGGSAYGDTWVPKKLLDKYRQDVLASSRQPAEYATGGVGRADQKAIILSAKKNLKPQPEPAKFDPGYQSADAIKPKLINETTVQAGTQRVAGEANAKPESPVSPNASVPAKGASNVQATPRFTPRAEPVTAESVGVKSSTPKGTPNEKPQETQPIREVQDGQRQVPGEQPQGQSQGQKADAKLPEKEEVKSTGLANQVQAREAADGIIDEIAASTGMKKGEAQAQGKAKVEAGLNVDHLAESIAKGDRPPSAVEFGALLEGKRRKMARINELVKEAKNNPGDPVTIRRIEEAEKDLDQYLNHIQKGKGKWSDVGRALQEGTTLDEGSYADVIQRVKGHNPKALTPKLDEQIQKLTDKVNELHTKIKDIEAGKLPVEQKIKSIAAESRKVRTERTLTAIKAEREAAWKRLSSRTPNISSGVDPKWLIDNTKDLATIMTSYVREGMVALPDIVSRLNDELKGIGLPHRLSEDDARNILGTTLPDKRPPLSDYERNLRAEERRARAAVRAIVEGTKPRTAISQLNTALGELRLSDPVARALDIASGVSGIAGRILRDPIATPIARALGSNQRSIFSPGKFRGIMQGALGRQRNMVIEGLHGLDPDAMIKYGKRPGKITRLVSLTDIPAKDFHMNDVFDDFAHKLSGGDKDMYKSIMDQLRHGTAGPLTNEQVFEATNVAHEMAVRNTFMSDNLGSKALEGGNMMMGQFIRKQIPGPVGENLADALTLTKDLFFRYSKVIGNVSQDRFESSGGGLITGPFKLMASKLNKAGLTEYQARDVADKMAKGLYGVGLVALGGYLYKENKLRPDYVKTAKSQFVDWGDIEQIGGPLSPVLLGATLAAIDDNTSFGKERDAAKQKAVFDLLMNQPLTSGFTKLSDVTQGKEKALGSVAASALVPGIVAGTARRMDRYQNRTSYRKTKTVGDAFKSRVPGMRSSLPSGEVSRKKGTLPL